MLENFMQRLFVNVALSGEKKNSCLITTIVLLYNINLYNCSILHMRNDYVILIYVCFEYY